MILARETCSCPLTEDTGPSLVNSNVCQGMFLFMILLEGYIKGRCKIADPCNRLNPVQTLGHDYDFIVVGAGTAGSIVAGRLSENSNSKVLLIEAGGLAPIGSNVPSLFRTYWTDKSVNWGYYTVPADYCLNNNGKGCQWPRGKGVGGTSLLNGMMYHRGHAQDYENWVKAGATGWSWNENIPFFAMTENNKDIGTVVSPLYHSDKGNLPIQRFRHQGKLVEDLLNALKEAGYPIVKDFNNPKTPAGFAVAQAFNNEGQRCTTARAYLKPQSQRPNLNIKINSQITRVLIDSYKRAYGVEFIDVDGAKQIVTAKKEVILCAGALNTPAILMHSGIGPKETLMKHNISIVADLPVGKNMRNHLGVTLNFVMKNISNTYQLNWSALTEYLLNLNGPMSSTSITQVSGLQYSSLADIKHGQPDLQFFFNGFYSDCSKSGQIGELVEDCHPLGINVSTSAVALLPRSVGVVTITSDDPLVPPVFDPNFFSQPEDMILVKEAAKYMQKVFESDTMRNKYGVVLDPYMNAICSRQFKEWSEEWLECTARVHTDPQNHQSSTAAIGQVTDPKLRVYGIKHLRVADASSMPLQVTGNPQGAIMMVAERAAHFIKTLWAL